MSQYSRSFDLNDLDNPHTLAVLCVPPGATVLDLGVASGEPVARELQAQSCQVFGVDIDPDAAQVASQYCRDVRVADLDDPTALAPWPEPFDVVLALDVLEHLRHPAEVLRRAMTLVKVGGFVCVSIPNITHYSIRQQLLHGRFEYTDDGLLDRTHLRFFDWPAVVTLFQDAGVEITDVYRIQKPLHIGVEEHLDTELTEVFAADAEAETFQYFVIGRVGPAWAGQGRGALARLQEGFIEQRSSLREAQRYARDLELTVAKVEGEVAETKDALEQQRAELQEAQGYARHLESGLEQQRAELQEAQGYARHLESGLEQQRAELQEAQGYARHLESGLEQQRAELQEAQGYARHLESAVAKLEAQIKDLLARQPPAPHYEQEPALQSELTDRMNEIWLLSTQVEMLRKDLKVKDSFLKSVPTARKTPVETLGYEFPLDVGKTSVIGYRAVDRLVRLIRKLPGWSRISERAWRADRQRSGGSATG